MVVVQIEGDDEFEGEVRGEAQYQTALERIVGGRSDESVEFECVARLVREPDNHHDPNAVRVEIDGWLVGYIPRELAPDVGRFLIARGGPWAVGQCGAMIVGGWVRRGETANFGVRLDIEWPLRAEPQPVHAYHVSGIQPPQPNPVDGTSWTSNLLWLLTLLPVVGAVGAAVLWFRGNPEPPRPTLSVQPPPSSAAVVATPAPVGQAPVAPATVQPAAAPPPPERPAAIIKVDEPQEQPPRPANVPQPPRRPSNLR